MTTLARHALAVSFALVAATAAASSNPPTYTLPWTDNKQVLTYRSCGCADSCWIAELRERRTKRLLARLRCDCERLLFSRAPAFHEAPLPQPCAAINDRDDKMDAVAAEMKALVSAEPARPIVRSEW